jgi:anti-sigma regulatory factor (Ser/Thr protein kinase)
MFTLSQLVLIGGLAATRNLLVVALLEAFALLILMVGVAVAKFHRYRRAYEHGLREAAVSLERVRLAEDLHDLLGHELNLVALRAGLLGVSSTGEDAQHARAMREQVERAVLALREAIDVLHGSETHAGTSHPSSVEDVVMRAQASNMDLTLLGAIPETASLAVRQTISRIVAEGLSNAARHSPGESVTVLVSQQDDQVHLSVVTHGAHEPAARGPAGDRDLVRAGTGIEGLRSRIEALGGTLEVSHDGDDHTVSAAVATGAVGIAPTPTPASSDSRPLPRTLRWATAAVLIAVTVLTSYYAWATHDATLEPESFHHLVIGEPVTAARAILPAREALLAMRTTPRPPHASTCHYYTDGNYPLAMAAFQICDDGVKLTRVSDLRRDSPW